MKAQIPTEQALTLKIIHPETGEEVSRLDTGESTKRLVPRAQHSAEQGEDDV